MQQQSVEFFMSYCVSSLHHFSNSVDQLSKKRLTWRIGAVSDEEIRGISTLQCSRDLPSEGQWRYCLLTRW